MDAARPRASNGTMARCNSCNGVITRRDLNCYVCGEPVPGAPQRSKLFRLRFWIKPAVAAAKRVPDAVTGCSGNLHTSSAS